MPFARLLPERFHRLAREIAAFGVVGIINTALDFAVFNGLIFLGPLKANVVSTVIATTSSYVMNRRWTYRDRPRTALRREYTLFFAFNVIGLAIQEAVLGLAKYGLGFHEADSRVQLNLFKCVGVAVAMIFRFWAYRTFVFKPQPGAQAPADAAGPVVPAQRVSGEVRGGSAEEEFVLLTAELETELSAEHELSAEQELAAGPGLTAELDLATELGLASEFEAKPSSTG